MALRAGEDVYATLLLSDTYLPGVLVLAHSLRDAGTTKKLAVLVTLDTVSAEAVDQLRPVFDYVLPVPRIRNTASPANLHLMHRPDLHSAFTKINLWKLAQFRKIVYIDADVVACRAPDELFDLPHALAAAPDIGWPDLFNTGVLVLTPDVREYYALAGLAERGVSFDGADQGLLNMHFKNSYHRLPFTYNVTPSAHYQYLPAYRHFQASISLVHFIGPDKPWSLGRAASFGGGVYDELVAQWWAVYDRHYRAATPPPPGVQMPVPPPPPEIVQYFVKGEFRPPAVARAVDLGHPSYGQHADTLPPPPPQSFFASHEHRLSSPAPHQDRHPHPPPVVSFAAPGTGSDTETRPDQAPGPQPGSSQPPPPEHKPAAEPSWDAQWQPPPANAKPEAVDFPRTHYEMSQDTAPFVPPPRYPSPPRDMWYEVPASAPVPSYQRPAPIFPWETHQPAPTRVFADPTPPPPPPPPPLPAAPQAHSPSLLPPFAPQGSGAGAGVAGPHGMTSSPVDLKTVPTTPTMPTTVRALPASDPWASFTHANAWDDVPQIERYVDAFQKQHRRVRSRGGSASPGGLRAGDAGGSGSGGGSGVSHAGGAGDGPMTPPSSRRRHGLKVTDFPTEVERPSLPVTPAPIRRSTLWGGDGPGFGADGGAGAEGTAAATAAMGGGHMLPAAEGVPQQADWDPALQLQKLAQKQSEVLLQKLGYIVAGEQGKGGGGGDGAGDGGGGGGEGSKAPVPGPVPAPIVVSPKPVNPGGLDTRSVRSLDAGENGAASAKEAAPAPVFAATKQAEPSYLGPGLVFEKDEVYADHEVTAALPSEEEKDVLET